MIKYYCDRCNRVIEPKNISTIKIKRTDVNANNYEFMLCENCDSSILTFLRDSDATVETNRFLNPRG